MSKTLKAVFSPQKFTPSLMAHQDDFENLWQNNRPWVLSNMAHIAYFNETEVTAFTDALGAENTRFYDVEGAQAFMAIWESRAILAFRGSQPAEEELADEGKTDFFDRFNISPVDELKMDPSTYRFLSNDVLADLKFRKVPFDTAGEVEVHRGFLREINKIWGEISLDIQRHADSVPIWVTGHSLGAAMATLAGMLHPFEDVITFGEPRVGLDIGRAFRAKNHTRFVNGDDPVTKVPPEKVFNYDHHGNEHKIVDADGSTDLKYDHSIVYYSENLS